MADVRPFRAVGYARPTEAVTAPPYDVIDDDELETLRARDPYNVARLTLEPDAVVAGERLREWLADGVLVRDETPAVWWLEQDFVGPDGVARSRRGIVASLRAEPYSARAVLSHERTHRGPIEGRLALLEETRTQLEPIFLLYEGGPPVDGPPARPPDLELAGSRLWRLEGDHGVAAFFADRQLLIADGHHRYETAVEFAAEDGADRMLAVLVSTADQGLVIFPTHRVFAGRADIVPSGVEYASVEEAVDALDREPFDQAAAVLVRRDGVRLVRGDECALDVELVDGFGHDGISYTPDRDEAVRRVRSGDADAALLVRPLRVADVFERAREGQPLPQKATYFFPKLVSGVLLHPVDPVTDWLALCRAAVVDLENVLRALPTRDEREPVLRAGEGGDDTTAIDAAAEDVVVRRLEALGADLRLVSEELGVRVFGSGGGPTVVVDPIDGSVNAKRGIPFFSLSVAVADGTTMDDVFFGYVYDFGAREEWVAEEGGGALLGGTALSGPGPKGSIEILSLEGTTTHAIALAAPAMRGVARRLRVMGSLALSLCHLAAGRVDAVCCLKPARSIDIAAAQLLVRERGYAIELFEAPPFGRAPLDLGQRSRVVAAASPELCAQVAAALR